MKLATIIAENVTQGHALVSETLVLCASVISVYWGACAETSAKSKMKAFGDGRFCHRR